MLAITSHLNMINVLSVSGCTKRGLLFSMIFEFMPCFQWGSCYSIFSFICIFCRSLFFFWPLCCLFFLTIESCQSMCFTLPFFFYYIKYLSFGLYYIFAYIFCFTFLLLLGDIFCIYLIINPGFQLSSCYSIFSFMCNVLQIVVCPFVLFLLVIVLSVLRSTNSDYPFGIFKLFLAYILNRIQLYD